MIRAALLVLLLVAAACGGGGPPCGVKTQCAGLHSIVQCKGSSPETVSCPNGGICLATADAKSAECIAPFAVTGSLRFAKRTQTSMGLTEPVLTMLPNASVSVVAADGTVLGTTYAGEDGKYSVSYAAKAGDSVHVMVAAKSNPALLPVTVNSDKGINGFGGPTFTAEATHAADIDVDEPIAAAAFNILTGVGAGIRVAQQWSGIAQLIPVSVVYFDGGPGSYYRDRVIHIKGGGFDDDGFDDAVFLHETGHYVQDTISLTSSEGGVHTGAKDNPNLAWSEGFATWFSSAARNDPRYMDSYDTNGSRIFVFNLDTQSTTYNQMFNADPALTDGQKISEWMVGEILWDVIDSGATDDDPMQTATSTQVLTVLRDGITRVGHVDRGAPAIDLVDWLDEWFITHGTATCNDMKAVVGSVTFPYDFKAPGAACP